VASAGCGLLHLAVVRHPCTAFTPRVISSARVRRPVSAWRRRAIPCRSALPVTRVFALNHAPGATCRGISRESAACDRRGLAHIRALPPGSFVRIHRTAARCLCQRSTSAAARAAARARRSESCHDRPLRREDRESSAAPARGDHRRPPHRLKNDLRNAFYAPGSRVPTSTILRRREFTGPSISPPIASLR
jgi:hypothetical protein